MNKDVAILCKDLSISTYNLNNAKFNHSILNNIGNFAILYAVKNVIQHDKTYYEDEEIEYVNRCRCLIVPAANWISKELDISEVNKFLMQIEIPVIFLGLGCQSDSYEDDQDIDLHPSASVFLDLIKKNNWQVSSRGYITQNFLRKHQIESTITGCLSNLINKDPNLAAKLKEKWNKKAIFYSCVGSDINSECPVKRKAEIMLFNTGINNGFYIQQSYQTIINAFRFNNSYSESWGGATECLKNIFNPNSFEENNFKKTILQKTRFYISIDQWMEDVSRMDLCFGTRIHGNIIAQQSGCPSIVVYHDSRTKELAESMEYPRIAVEDFVKVKSVEELKEWAYCNFDFYEQKRIELKENIKSILNPHGISVK